MTSKNKYPIIQTITNKTQIHMKALLIFLCLSLQIINSAAQYNKVDGKWTGTDETGDSAVLTFSGKTLIMEYEGEQASPCDYKIDYTKDPIWIDLIMKNEDQNEVIPALIKFIDDNTIKLEVFPFASSRPVKFSSESNELNENTIILKRIQY
jgi:uncharacterized protein (TIGR03067 family)